jgi:hypothetical protein
LRGEAVEKTIAARRSLKETWSKNRGPMVDKKLEDEVYPPGRANKCGAPLCNWELDYGASQTTTRCLKRNTTRPVPSLPHDVGAGPHRPYSHGLETYTFECPHCEHSESSVVKY